MRLRTLAVVLALTGLALSLAACGGDDDDGRPIVRISNSPIPTVTAAAPTAVICEVAEPQALPANFPADIVPVPPDFVASTVETEPYLRVVGRVTPPPDERPTHIVVSDALNFILGRTFELQLQPRVEGMDWNFSHSDGRRGHYNARPVTGCFGQVEIVFDLEWVTPDTPPPAPVATTAAEPDV
jgi:hypothetical protein